MLPPFKALLASGASLLALAWLYGGGLSDGLRALSVDGEPRVVVVQPALPEEGETASAPNGPSQEAPDAPALEVAPAAPDDAGALAPAPSP